jgi:hypothetical protein
VGKSRWRKMAGQNGIPRRQAKASTDVSVTVDSVTTRCPGMERAGLDGIVTLGLRKIDALVREMRKNVLVPNGVQDQESSVKRYLAFLSMLVDIALADIVMSAVHSNDLAVLMKERMLVEYASKAVYFNNHPDYALFMTTIHEATSIRDKIRDGGGSASDLADAEEELRQRLARFSDVAHLKKLTLSQIMRAQTRGGDPARNDEYVWLYGAPSALMHGDSEGMRMLLPVDEEGKARRTIQLSDAHLNALMVDAGSNALIFCDAFIDRFHPGDANFAKGLSDLACEFKSLSLKHPDGRDVDALPLIRAELDAAESAAPNGGLQTSGSAIFK